MPANNSCMNYLRLNNYLTIYTHFDSLPTRTDCYENLFCAFKLLRFCTHEHTCRMSNLPHEHRFIFGCNENISLVTKLLELYLDHRNLTTSKNILNLLSYMYIHVNVIYLLHHTALFMNF